MRRGDADRTCGGRCPHPVSASSVRARRRRHPDFGLRPAPPNHHHPRLRAAPLTRLGAGFAGVGGLYARLLISSLPFSPTGFQRAPRSGQVPTRSARGQPLFPRAAACGKAHPHFVRVWPPPPRRLLQLCFRKVSHLKQNSSLRSSFCLPFSFRKKLENGLPTPSGLGTCGANRPPQQKIGTGVPQPLGGLFLPWLPPEACPLGRPLIRRRFAFFGSPNRAYRAHKTRKPIRPFF